MLYSLYVCVHVIPTTLLYIVADVGQVVQVRDADAGLVTEVNRVAVLKTDGCIP